MRISPVVLLLFTMLGCGSKSDSANSSTQRTPAVSTPAEKTADARTTAANTPDAAEVKKHMTPAPLALGEPITNSVGMVLVPIPAGEFMMGSPESEKGGQDSEHQHRVRITKPFYLAMTEVTQKQWETVMGTTPWKGEKHVKEGPNFPATHVSWEDAQEYCRKLSATEGVSYRLPTEAEWEYACRAGSQSMYSFSANAAGLKDNAWVKENAYDIDEKYAHEVGRKRANAWGMYDMHGNVREWCSDWYEADYYKNSPARDPTGPGAGQFRVSRGGSWYNVAEYCRSAFRYGGSPDYRSSGLGFRVAAVRVIAP